MADIYQGIGVDERYLPVKYPLTTQSGDNFSKVAKFIIYYALIILKPIFRLRFSVTIVPYKVSHLIFYFRSIISVLNGTPQRPVCTTGRGVLQISDHNGEVPVYPTCMLIYRPAGVYFGRPVHHTNSQLLYEDLSPLQVSNQFPS